MKFFFAILISFNLYAMPEEIEIWLLDTGFDVTQTEPKAILELAQSANYRCVKLGTDCFDPDIGRYKPVRVEEGSGIAIPKSDVNPEVRAYELTNPEDKSTIMVIKNDSQKCKNTNYFSEFCGTSQEALNKKIDLEILIDGTQSMGKTDPTDLKGNCYRGQFIKELTDGCSNQNMKVKVFGFSSQEVSNPLEACQSRGIASEATIQDWVRNSTSKKLILITDLTEIDHQFLRFAIDQGAIVKGDKLTKKFGAKNLLNEAQSLAKTCRSMMN